MSMKHKNRQKKRLLYISQRRNLYQQLPFCSRQNDTIPFSETLFSCFRHYEGVLFLPKRILCIRRLVGSNVWGQRSKKTEYKYTRYTKQTHS